MASISDHIPFVVVFSIKENGQIKVTVVVKQKKKGFIFSKLAPVFSTFINLALSVFTVRPSTAARAQRADGP